MIVITGLLLPSANQTAIREVTEKLTRRGGIENVQKIVVLCGAVALAMGMALLFGCRGMRPSTGEKESAAGPDAFDNSGLLDCCFKEQGVSVPRCTRDLYPAGTAVEKSGLLAAGRRGILSYGNGGQSGIRRD